MHVTLPAGTLIALLTELTDYYILYSCNTGNSGLHDIYNRNTRATCPRANHECMPMLQLYYVLPPFPITRFLRLANIVLYVIHAYMGSGFDLKCQCVTYSCV